MKQIMIAAAMVALAAGAADARPAKHVKSHATSAERAATRQLNEQQLAAANTGSPAGAMRSDAPPAPGAMPAPPAGDNMAPPAPPPPQG